MEDILNIKWYFSQYGLSKLYSLIITHEYRNLIHYSLPSSQFITNQILNVWSACFSVAGHKHLKQITGDKNNTCQKDNKIWYLKYWIYFVHSFPISKLSCKVQNLQLNTAYDMWYTPKQDHTKMLTWRAFLNQGTYSRSFNYNPEGHWPS
jgi:hypothetical protein